jgi:hypothetical protein
MEIVYKFCGAFGPDILRNLELKVTPPNQFNDPFEFTPRMVCNDPAHYAKRLFRKKDVLRKFYEMMRREGKFDGAFRDFRTKVDQEWPAMIKMMDEAMRYNLPRIEEEHLDRASEQYGVLCLSARRDSILMWGHYCDRDSGLVIGFDASAAVFQQGKGLRRVKYVEHRVVFDANWRIGSAQMSAYDDQLILSKGSEWSYERELRQFFKLTSLIKKPLRNGSPGYFLPIPSSAIVSVTLSPRRSRQCEGEIQTILRVPTFRHVRLDRAILHQTDFSLTFQ